MKRSKKFFIKTTTDYMIDIGCGYKHTLFLIKCGNVYSFRLIKHERCGHRQAIPQINVPKLIKMPNNNKIISTVYHVENIIIY